MDQQYEALRRFSSALGQFNEELRLSMAELERHHDRTSPIWSDSVRQDFDRRWEELREPLESYVSRAAPDYERFVNERIVRLGNYLHGR